MGQYLQAENLKFKRTFMKKLIFLAPMVTLLIAILSVIWFQANGFNWWYMIMLPGCIALMAALSNQKEEKKLHYRAVFALPVSLKKVWISKVLLISIYVALSCGVLSVGIVLGGFILPVPTTVMIFRAVVAAILIAVTFLWQIPLCLFLAKRLGIGGTVLINGGVGIILNTLTASTSMWWICPYGWTSRLMCPVLGILPNGTLAEAGNPLLNPEVIPVGLMLSVALFALLLRVTANWFQRQEVN